MLIPLVFLEGHRGQLSLVLLIKIFFTMNILFFFFFLTMYLVALCLSCSMWALAPWPGIKPRPPALGAHSPSHWTTRWWWRFSHSAVSDSCDPMDCSLPGASVHGMLQARALEWVAISFSRGSSWPRNQTQISWIAGRLLTNWAISEVPQWTFL